MASGGRESRQAGSFVEVLAQAGRRQQQPVADHIRNVGSLKEPLAHRIVCSQCLDRLSTISSLSVLLPDVVDLAALSATHSGLFPTCSDLLRCAGDDIVRAVEFR